MRAAITESHSKVLGGVTQGNLMYTTIFNVVVDEVVHHWVSWVVEEAEGPYGWGREVLL